MSRSICVIRAVLGICEREDKVLIAERPQGKTYSGYWEFPGGKIEENESPYQALQRELDEELGIQVLRATHVLDYHYSYPDKQVHLSVWRVHSFSGEPVGRENQIFTWALPSELQQFKILAGNGELIKKIF